MSITVKVYSGTSPGTLIATLNSRRNPNWLHQLNDPGSGSVQVHIDDADLAAHPTLVNYDNIVRCQIGGTDRFAFFIEQPDLPPVPADERSGLWWTLSGRGVLAFLDDAIVREELAGTNPTDRTFGWMAIAYDDSAWTSAVQIRPQNQIGAPIGWYTRMPEGWPDHSAYWIWSRASVEPTLPYMPPGTVYFRKSFTLANDSSVAVFATADDSLSLWLDDELILESDNWTQTNRVDKDLKAGTHYLAARATNNNRGATANPGNFICSVMEVADTGLTGTVFARTNNTWKALDYPANVPGMPIGQIIRQLVSEAQTRGGLVGITLGFTDTLDTNGNAFSVVPDEAFQVGTKCLAAIQTLCEQYIDVEMTPTLVLNAYNKGTLGSDLTGSVSLLRGTHFEELGGQSSGHLTNAMLARTQDGTLVTREDATSLAARRRKEEYVELATAPSVGQAQRVMDALFPDFAYPVIQLSGKVTEASGPYTTYKPGDTIKMPNKANVATATSVISLACEEDDAGNLIYHIEGMQTDS